MSKLRFKVGDSALVIPPHPNAGEIVIIEAVGPFPLFYRDPRDGVRYFGKPDYLVRGEAKRYGAAMDKHLKPLNPPKEDDVDKTVDPAWKKLKDQLQITADLVKEKRREKA